MPRRVLAETPLFALDHVSKRFQLPAVGPGHRLAATAVVQQRIHGFLQHALFVTDDDVRCIEIQQPAQPVVAVDHTAVKIIEVRCRKAPALKRHQGTKIGRQHR